MANLTNLEVLKIVKEAIKYKEEMNEIGRGCNLLAFVVSHPLLWNEPDICYCDNPNREQEKNADFKVCSNCRKPFEKPCDHYFPTNKKGVVQPCEFCGEIKKQTK